MKAKSSSPDEDTRKLEERFDKFAKALMAVPKKELDKELGKQAPRHKRSGTRSKKSSSG